MTSPSSESASVSLEVDILALQPCFGAVHQPLSAFSAFRSSASNACLSESTSGLNVLHLLDNALDYPVLFFNPFPAIPYRARVNS